MAPLGAVQTRTWRCACHAGILAQHLRSGSRQSNARLTPCSLLVPVLLLLLRHTVQDKASDKGHLPSLASVPGLGSGLQSEIAEPLLSIHIGLQPNLSTRDCIARCQVRLDSAVPPTLELVQWPKCPFLHRLVHGFSLGPPLRHSMARAPAGLACPSPHALSLRRIPQLPSPAHCFHAF